MDWNSIQFDWNCARAFLVTAEEGSLSAAARALGTTQPTIGRQVSALEKALGVVLFERAGKGLLLTQNGLGLLKHVRTMGDAANRLSIVASGLSQSLEGKVCISASEVYTSFILPPIIAHLRQLQPRISIEIIATSQVSDLQRHEADIALRNFRPTQPDLIAKKIKNVNARLYATPDYLRRLGSPITLEHLNQAEFISFDRGSMLMDGLNNLGLELKKSNFPIVTESYITHWELVKQGLGIGIIPEEIGDAEPLVKQALPAFPAIVFPIWLTSH
ncbi:MAG: LysR family transcriptional regulator, partial [Gammaproteobacteria bacterium]|nr:LysR family transcriptional regulator [Gammaproteobacteria bacterium]